MIGGIKSFESILFQQKNPEKSSIFKILQTNFVNLLNNMEFKSHKRERVNNLIYFFN